MCQVGADRKSVMTCGFIGTIQRFARHTAPIVLRIITNTLSGLWAMFVTYLGSVLL